MQTDYSTAHLPLAAALYTLSPLAYVGVRKGENGTIFFLFEEESVQKDREIQFYSAALWVPARQFADSLKWARTTMKKASNF